MPPKHRRRYNGSASKLDAAFMLVDSGSFMVDWARLGKKGKQKEVVRLRCLLGGIYKLTLAHGPLTKIQVEQALIRADAARKLCLEGWNKASWASQMGGRIRAALRYISQNHMKQVQAPWMRMLLAELEDRQLEPGEGVPLQQEEVAEEEEAAGPQEGEEEEEGEEEAPVDDSATEVLDEIDLEQTVVELIGLSPPQVELE